ncbi:MAG: hypothetical protein NC203_05285 [Firmicutes bacterium]|nr:hypothetical protein [[Eubacterium] siraeum]MCM1487764.1 hypothetical protein [Bacillota bacterium]
MKKQKLSERMKNIRSLTILFFIVTAVIWIALLLVKMYFFEFSPEALFDDIVSNILGILPPIIIFNFVYEYYTQKYESDEISEKIADTIMGRSDIMSRFKDEQKIDFIGSTINTMVSPEAAEMTNAVIYPYITNSYNIRTYFKYSIILRDYETHPLFPKDRYMKVYENFKFTKKYINDDNLPQDFHVGFITANHELDTALRNQNYIFQENLSIDDKELQQLLAMSEEECKKIVMEEMQLSVYIDDLKAEMTDITFTAAGIDMAFHSEHVNKLLKKFEPGVNMGKYDYKTEHSVEISFAMAQIKGHSEFLVSINEPTYSPIIQLSYPESSMSIRAYSFLNDGDESSVEKATHNVGTYEFCIQNKWIYPVGGVVFVIDDLKS